MPNYQVNEIYRAIQGEGWNTGLPCVIVRFQGCNLRCPFCDTGYALNTDGGTEYSMIELRSAINEKRIVNDIVLFTGGEPTLQPIGKALMYNTHLETNGTQQIPEGFAWVTVSPKPGGDVVKEAMDKADEIKWLVYNNKDVEKLLRFIDEWDYKNKVSVQPLSLGEDATDIAVEAVGRYGWRLSLQTHKFIGKR